LAAAIRDERRTEALPVLADALAEAGLEDLDVLAHLREPGHRAEQCWVVDLLLERPVVHDVVGVLSRVLRPPA
jgi:hypothetical protein